MEIETSIQLAAGIVTAFATTGRIAPTDVPKILAETHAAVVNLAEGRSLPGTPEQPKLPTPAEIKKSITTDHLISFEDGAPYKTLRRHLTKRGLTPETYRAKYGLPADYPMTSAGYSKARSDLAKSFGLGQKPPATA